MGTVLSMVAHFDLRGMKIIITILPLLWLMYTVHDCQPADNLDVLFSWISIRVGSG